MQLRLYFLAEIRRCTVAGMVFATEEALKVDTSFFMNLASSIAFIRQNILYRTYPNLLPDTTCGAPLLCYVYRSW